MFSSEIKSVHFTGIGGTAMAAAAAAMLDKGFQVTGSDQNVYEPMASFLAAKKIAVLNGYDERHLAHKPDLVVIGNAISRGNPEAEFVLEVAHQEMIVTRLTVGVWTAECVWQRIEQRDCFPLLLDHLIDVCMCRIRFKKRRCQ